MKDGFMTTKDFIDIEKKLKETILPSVPVGGFKKENLQIAQKQIEKATSKNIGPHNFFIYDGIVFAEGKEPVFLDGSKPTDEQLEEIRNNFKKLMGD